MKPASTSLVYGTLIGSSVYLIFLAITMLAAPRTAEGIRQTVSWPWPLYASLPAMLTTLAVFPLSFARLPTSIHKLSLIFAAGVSIILWAASTLELLHRDFLGKF